MLRNSLPEHVENSIHKRLKISANHIREKHTDDRKMIYRFLSKQCPGANKKILNLRRGGGGWGVGGGANWRNTLLREGRL